VTKTFALADLDAAMTAAENAGSLEMVIVCSEVTKLGLA